LLIPAFLKWWAKDQGLIILWRDKKAKMDILQKVGTTQATYYIFNIRQLNDTKKYAKRGVFLLD
jgi:hypothetical protein